MSDGAPEVPADLDAAIAQRQAADPSEFFADTAEPEAIETPAVPSATPPAGGAEGVPPTPAATGTPAPAPVALSPWTDEHGNAVDSAEVQAALTVARGLRTPEGVRLMVARGLEAMNKDPRAIQAFLNGEITQQQAEAAPAAPPEPVDPLAAFDLTDDDVIDGAQLRKVLAAVTQQATEQAQAAAAAALQPLAERQQAEQANRAKDAVDSTLIQLLGENGDAATVDVDTANLVLDRAKAYIDPNNWDPQHIRDAVLRGHADLVAQLDRAQTARLARLAQTAQNTPSSIGTGTPPGGETPAEPVSFEEAMAQARVGHADLFQ